MIKINDTIIDETKVSAITKYGYKATDKRGIIVIVDGCSIAIPCTTIQKRDDTYDEIIDFLYKEKPVDLHEYMCDIYKKRLASDDDKSVFPF